jgi:glutamate synthase domain-containing protein 3
VEVLGEGVVVVAGSWLAGVAETAAVISNDALAGGEEDGNLFLPGGAAERISVDENDGIAGAVVLIIKVDVG